MQTSSFKSAFLKKKLVSIKRVKKRSSRYQKCPCGLCSALETYLKSNSEETDEIFYLIIFNCN